MNTVEDLFSFILKNDQTIVFGNLGRHVHVLHEALTQIPHLQISVISFHYPFLNNDHRIRVLGTNDAVDSCDLLVMVEPPSSKTVQKHPMAMRAVVFTSHFSFHTAKEDRWSYASYFHGMEDCSTQNLLELQDFPIQTRNISHVKVDYPNVFTITGSSTTAPTESDTYIIVDLTKYTKDILSMYLAYWDAFDFMLEHASTLHRWVVCFSEPNGRRAFERFAQKTIDQLFCLHFEHGNVTKIQDILGLIPFYKSGTIDQHFDIQTSSFGGIPIIVAKTYQDACKAAVTHNLKPIVHNIFQVQE